MSSRVFQIALVDRISSRDAPYFDYTAKNIITYTLWDHLVRIAAATTGGFIPGPSWSLLRTSLQAHDVVVYFVLDPSRSLAGGTQVANAGGFTKTTSAGVVCEVYVDGNMPARRLANIAFHELMHNKLDVGATVLNDLHRQGGGGLAVPPTSEQTPLTSENIRLMSRHLFGTVRQYTGGM
ncbi:hypothetical protein ACFL5O_08100 [Myxococcota bacterium]